MLVAVLHHNAPAQAAATAAAFLKQVPPHSDVVVFDIGSTAAHRRRLESACQSASIRWIPQNCGYTGGGNAAIRHARDARYDFVVITNDDVEVGEQSLAHLIETAARWPDAGLVGGIEVCGASAAVRAAGGGVYSLWTGRGTWRSAPVTGTTSHRVPYVQGALIGLTRAALDAGVEFDESLFMYYDEIDLSYALRRVGLSIYLDPRVQVIHRNDLSLNPRCTYLLWRNRVYLVRKHGRWFHVLTTVLLMAIWPLPRTIAGALLRWRLEPALASVLGLAHGIAGVTGHSGVERFASSAARRLAVEASV